MTIWGIGLRKQQKMLEDETRIVRCHVKRLIVDCRASYGGYVTVLSGTGRIDKYFC